MIRKIFLPACILLSTFYTAFSQDSSKSGKFTLSGSVDGYFRYNFSNAKDVGKTNNYTSFTNSQNSFELGMASLKAEHSIGKVSATLDLGFGKRAEEFSYNDNNTLFAIKQAFVSYAPSDKFKLTMGKWATHVGYELVDAYLNRNYSMAYMFSYGPFFHTGIKGEATLGKVGLMLGVVNPTDRVTADFSKKFLIGQVSTGTNDGKMKAYLNYLGGKDLASTRITQVDLVLTGTLSDKFSLGYNGTIQSVKPTGKGSDSWWGSALYVNVDPTPVLGFTLRGEYFDDSKAASGGAFGTSIFDATLSANIRLDNLTIIPEFRLDNAKDAIFFNNSNGLIKSTSTFILAATYHF